MFIQNLYLKIFQIKLAHYNTEKHVAQLFFILFNDQNLLIFIEN